MKINAITKNYKALLEDIGHKPTLVENEDKACSCGMGLSWRDELATGKCRYCKEWGPDWRKQMAHLDAKAQKQYENKYKYGKPGDEPVTEDIEFDIPEPIMKQDVQKGQCCKCGDKAIKLNDVHPGDGFAWEFPEGKELCKRCYDKAQVHDEPEEFDLFESHEINPSKEIKCRCGSVIPPSEHEDFLWWGKCKECRRGGGMNMSNADMGGAYRGGGRKKKKKGDDDAIAKMLNNDENRPQRLTNPPQDGPIRRRLGPLPSDTDDAYDA